MARTLSQAAAYCVHFAIHVVQQQIGRRGGTTLEGGQVEQIWLEVNDCKRSGPGHSVAVAQCSGTEGVWKGGYKLVDILAEYAAFTWLHHAARRQIFNGV